MVLVVEPRGFGSPDVPNGRIITVINVVLLTLLLAARSRFSTAFRVEGVAQLVGGWDDYYIAGSTSN